MTLSNEPSNEIIVDSITLGFKTALIFLVVSAILSFIFEFSAKWVFGFDGPGSINKIFAIGGISIPSTVQIALFLSILGLSLAYFAKKINSIGKFNALFVVFFVAPIAFGLAPGILTGDGFAIKWTYSVVAVFAGGMLFSRQFGIGKPFTYLLFFLVAYSISHTILTDLSTWDTELYEIAKHFNDRGSLFGKAAFAFVLCEALKVALNVYVFFFVPYQMVKKVWGIDTGAIPLGATETR